MQLSKHHGLGNDFLVLDDLDGRHAVDGATARALCDRRTGVGADGLIVIGKPTEGGADVRMTLRNADGGVAEMSGNGIRCLGHAVAMSRGADELDLTVETDAGFRRLWVRPGADARTAEVRAEIGTARDDEVPPAAAPTAQKVAAVDLGNPHLVLLYDSEAAADAAVDPRPGDRNVEYAVARADGSLRLRIVERGVGETHACGTGACAAAWAARQWGLVGDRVSVDMPGGTATVDLDDPIALSGPVVYVATVEVPWL